MDYRQGYMQSMLQIERLEAQAVDMASTTKELRSQVKEKVVRDDVKRRLQKADNLIHILDQDRKESEIPYGEDWTNEVLKFTKEELAELLRQACLRRDELQIEVDNINIDPTDHESRD